MVPRKGSAKVVLRFLKISIILAIIADPGEISCSVTFHLCLHSASFGVSSIQRVNIAYHASRLSKYDVRQLLSAK